MKRIGWIGLGWLLGFSVGWAQERPAEWLRRAVRAEQTLTVSGERVTEIRMGRRTERIVERFWRQGGRAIRIEVLAPPERRGEILLLRGDKWILYRPTMKDAILLPAPLHPHERMLQRLLMAVEKQAMTLTLNPPESVLNRACIVLNLKGAALPAPRKPREPAPPFAREPRHPEPIQNLTLWIDRETGLVLRREVRFADPDRWVRMEITRLELPTRLPVSLFELPEGVVVRTPREGRFERIEEAQKAAGFPIRLPDYLPDGTRQEGIIVRRLHDRALVAIRYRCPQGNFTLVQTRAPNADFKLPQPPHQRPLNTHFWQVGDYWFGLVGSLPKEEMERIARSINR